MPLLPTFPSPHPPPRSPQEHHDFPQETTSGKGLLVLCSDTVRIQWIGICCGLAAGKRDETTWALILCKQLCCAYGTQFGHYYAHNRNLCVGMLKPLAWLQDAHILLPPAHHWNHHKVAALGSHSRPLPSARILTRAHTHAHTHTRTHIHRRTRTHTQTHAHTHAHALVHKVNALFCRGNYVSRKKGCVRVRECTALQKHERALPSSRRTHAEFALAYAPAHLLTIGQF